MRQTTPYKIQTTHLELQDEIADFDDLTALEDGRVFSLIKQPVISYEKDKNAQVDITIEMDLNRKVISRNGYTLLDLISDIGGIQGMLISGVAIVVGIWNYNMIDNHLVSRLYKL